MRIKRERFYQLSIAGRDGKFPSAKFLQLPTTFVMFTRSIEIGFFYGFLPPRSFLNFLPCERPKSLPRLLSVRIINPIGLPSAHAPPRSRRRCRCAFCHTISRPRLDGASGMGRKRFIVDLFNVPPEKCSA